MHCEVEIMRVVWTRMSRVHQCQHEPKGKDADACAVLPPRVCVRARVIRT